METKTFYVCEPNTALRAEIVHNLSKTFTHVGNSGDGSECLNCLNTCKVDLLVFDFMLSTIDGFSLLEEIKNSSRIVKPKMIVISSLTQDGFISKALSEGVDYLMIKPVSLSILSERANMLFEKSNSSESMNSMALKSGVVTMPRTNRRIEERISNIFITVGIPAHIKGYQFLREAIKLAIESPEIINSITKKLYPTIATNFATSASKVERAIRHAIEVAWNRGKIENINNLFNLKVYSSNEKPTNGEFIALVADKMLIEGA